ncbi:MAG: spore germination protein [Clostridia bacterium]|jgi:spore germination protein KA|nr:spore germination protein [Clostridia bacterium]
MKIKEIVNNIFSYTPPINYKFILPDNSDTENSNNIQTKGNIPEKKENIFASLDVNLDYIKMKYNLLINSDIITREFILNARGKQHKALLLYIDGMVDSQSLNDFVLQPLMMRNKNNLFDGDQNRIISEAVSNNITVRKVKKFDLADYIESCLIPQNNIEKTNSFDEIFSGVNSGNCALFVDTLNIAFNIDIKGFKQRNIDKPQNEIVIKGPHEAFVENIRTNTSLLRRFSNNEDLVIESLEVGTMTKTKCAVCYMQNIANNDLIAEIKYRINNLDVDSILSIGQLEQLISDNNSLGLPRAISTERPDNAVQHILEGRVVVLLNGSPFALILPAIMIDFLTSPEDRNLKTIFSNFLRAIRILAAFFALLLPGLYVSVTSFHIEILPTELLYSILAARESVPFPVIFEILIMEISFEIIREASLRVPSPIGTTIGIVGGLVVGQAAVSAGIVSPILIIIVAITALSSFAIPDYTFSFHLRVFRFLFVFLGYAAGFLGIGIGLFVYLSIICDMESFGVSYSVPYSTMENLKSTGIVLPPIWKREYRSAYLATKKSQKQKDISMKWKFQ